MNNGFESAGFKKLTKEELYALDFNPFTRIDKQWFLVTAGDREGWNTMTASWGFAGVIWNRPSFITVIRPQRYTKEFIDKSEYFTVSFLPEEHRSKLIFCGRNSGRDCDKAAETGLVPVFGQGVTGFEQAELILVCKKQYVKELDSEGFMDKALESANYSGDYHTQYIGEIVEAWVK